MHPSLSIIAFTTASGAGYGLLALLGVSAAIGLVPPDPWLGAAGVGLALALITTGLLSSTLHLGHPERAWRALSQWRSSWLSREGVASIVTYVPAMLLALGWVVLGRTDGWVAVIGLAAAAMAMATVFTTSMIYASLKPVPQWHSPYTVPGYFLFALMTGAVLLNAVLHVAGRPSTAALVLAAVAIAAGWAWKASAWRHNDALHSPVTANSATGLAGGAVRSVEWPHTEANYLLKELGFRIARKHAAKLRRLAHLFAFALPLALTLAAMATGGTVAIIAVVAAVLVQVPGVLIERWLFFAEARHVVSVYYGY